MWAEIRRRDGWDAVGSCFDNTWHKPDAPSTKAEDGYESNAPKTEHPFDERDYELYAFLADVRNDYDLAPISTPRGVPDDASGYYKQQVETWGDDGHSHSWLLLSELKAANTDQEFHDSRVIISRDVTGRITCTAASTTGEHLGIVGRRKLFSLWGTDNWLELIGNLEGLKRWGLTDDAIRAVFFFDN